MKIGVDSYSYHRNFGEIYEGQTDPGIKWDLHDFFKHIKKNNKDIEAISLETCFINAKEKSEILDILHNVNYEVAFAWGHPNGFMDVNIDDAIKEITDYIRLSSAVGQKVMRIVASSIAYYYKPHFTQMDSAIQTIKRLVSVAKDYGVKLALENHGDFHNKEILTILDNINSDYFGIAFDTGNSLRLHEDCISAVREYGKKVLLVHAKDVAPEKKISTGSLANLNCVPAGEGIVDFKSIFSELNRNQYDGMVLIEISRLHSSFDNIDETEIINRGMKHLRNLRRELKNEYNGN